MVDKDSYPECRKDGLELMPCGCVSNLAVKDNTCEQFVYWDGKDTSCDRCFHDKECHK